MAISAAPLEMQAKKPSASISKVKGEVRRSSTRLKTSWFSHRAYIKTGEDVYTQAPLYLSEVVCSGDESPNKR